MLNFRAFKLYTILKFVHNLFINWDIVLKILLYPFGTSGLRSLPLTLATSPEFPTGFTEPRSRFRWFGPAFNLYEIFNFRCGSPLQHFAKLIPNLQHRTLPTAKGVLLDAQKNQKAPLRGNNLKIRTPEKEYSGQTVWAEIELNRWTAKTFNLFRTSREISFWFRKWWTIHLKSGNLSLYSSASTLNLKILLSFSLLLQS